MTVELTRYFWSDVQTRGALMVRDGDSILYQCLTLELPWRDNRSRVSCIPPGPKGEATYLLRHRSGEESGTFKYPHFLLEGVEDRSYILIHRGNLYTQILGCILVGREFVDINDDGHPDVTSSTRTLKTLREIVPDRTRLTVSYTRAMDKPIPAQEPERIDVSQAIEVPDTLA